MIDLVWAQETGFEAEVQRLEEIRTAQSQLILLRLEINALFDQLKPVLLALVFYIENK
jgi:hypothetical protein